MLSNISQLQKDKNPMIPFILEISKSQMCRSRKWKGALPGLGAGGNIELMFNGYNVSVIPDEEVLGNLLYNIVPIFKNTVVHLKFCQRVCFILSICITKTKTKKVKGTQGNV